MAEITLSVLRCPDTVVPEQRRASGGELSLGRGAECDWVLADPDRVLSKKHCVLEFFGGGWQVRDTSTNGTFVNHASSPVGRDQVKPLMDGDRLRLGSYEIEVRIAEAPAASGGWGGAADPFAPQARDPYSPQARDPYAVAPRDPFAAEAPNPFAPPPPRFDSTPLPGLSPPARGGLLPDDFDPFADNAAPMPDHAPSTAEAFMVPPSRPVGKALIPDDWDLGLTPTPTPAPPPAPMPPPPVMNPFAEAPMPPPVAPAPPPAAIAPPPPIAPAPMPSDAAAALAALFEGAGLPPAMAARAQQDPDAALRAAGAMLRAAVAGLRALLIARADVKREFRIEQTMLRASDNNPLKFAATEEQALAALLDPRSPALRAVQETVDDLTAHQVAGLAATQAAARALLERLAPASLEAEDPGGGLLPGAKEKRLWEAYKRRHAQLVDQFEDDFDSAFGKAFARAYEQATGKRGR
ncbi:type VI secretion system-associated FHA domain protein TagH [Roseomonas stagni]|uniref:Type VI secretion system-associated FHA domain protein TagH n=1 Tax=Falsiroseomonas algicola TaxID=2716930 RepID=A0A6M1LI60_9PROT|nr:type VI secretion system-associated FHA domain protein TagH [Falsiroseomonas algicola]NGM19857.1 type VI secretion system-associated FHA domain protein TagH [Falsiroseomonas algicola]